MRDYVGRQRRALRKVGQKYSKTEKAKLNKERFLVSRKDKGYYFPNRIDSCVMQDSDFALTLYKPALKIAVGALKTAEAW